MSTQITTAFVQEFKRGVMLLAQQKGSKLSSFVRTDSVTGKQAFFDQVGATAARRRTGRHTDTPRMETPHARRRCALEDFDWADLIDQEDKVRLLNDPTSSYVQSASNAMGRAKDEVIVDAMRGTAYSGETGSTSTVLPSGSKVAVGGAGLNIGKLIAAKKILDASDIDSDRRHIALTSEQVEDLLNNTTFTSADYNSVKALVSGQINEFMGFSFHRGNMLANVINQESSGAHSTIPFVIPNAPRPRPLRA
jgi:hypothetical protein